MEEKEIERQETKSIFETVHFRFGAQWLSLLEQVEEILKKKEEFKATLQREQEILDKTLFAEEESSLSDLASVSNGTAPHKNPPTESKAVAIARKSPSKGPSLLEKLSSPLLGSSHRLYHSVGIEIQSVRDKYSEQKRERTSSLEDSKLVLLHFSCDRYLGLPADPLSNGKKELESVLHKFALESGLSTEEVYDRCFDEVKALLVQLKKAGDMNQRLLASSKDIKARLKELDTKWGSLCVTDAQPETDAGNLEKTLDEIAVALHGLQQLIAVDADRMKELKVCTKEISKRSTEIRLRTQAQPNNNHTAAQGRYVEPKNGDNFISLPTVNSRRASMKAREEKSKSAEQLSAVPDTFDDSDLSGGGKKKGRQNKAKLRAFSSRNPSPATSSQDGGYGERSQIFLPAGVDSRVYYFLQQLGLLRVYDAFLKEGMTFENLRQLNDSKLNAMAINPSARKTILANIQKGTVAGHSVIKKGWMVKKGDRVKNWKIRFFLLLDSGELRYYDSEDTPKANGVVELTGEAIIYAPSQDRAAKDYAFDIITPTRTYVFCCATEADYVDWQAKLKSVMQVGRKGR